MDYDLAVWGGYHICLKNWLSRSRYFISIASDAIPSFYVSSGVDLMPLLVKLGTSEALQAKYAAAGDFLVAYIIYEIAKPVRYLATLGATRQTVFYLRKRGYVIDLCVQDRKNIVEFFYSIFVKASVFLLASFSPI